MSIKEKVAYIVGLVYADEGLQAHGIALTSKRNLQIARIKNNLHEIITDAEKHLFSNAAFTESRILRNSAVNRFECKLSTSETHQLNSFVLKIQKLCSDNDLDTLAESTHFTNESDAQKIMKISDIIVQISASGVIVNSNLLKEFDKIDEKIKPLRDLDKRYKHVTKALNMLHRIAQIGYHSMIRPGQQASVDRVLAALDMTKTVNDALIDFNKLENFDKNQEHGFLDKLLEQIELHPKYKETLYSIPLTKSQFREWFYSGSAFALMEAAKR